LDRTPPTKGPAAIKRYFFLWEPKGEDSLYKYNKATNTKLNFAKIVSQTLNRVSSVFSWQRVVKHSPSLMNPFIRIGSLMMGRTSTELVLGLTSITRYITRLYNSQGYKGVALYLKASQIYLMKYASGELLKNSSAFGPVIGLTRDGIPLFVPLYWRLRLRKGNKPILKLLLTICNLYRVLPFKGSLKLSTITGPSTATTDFKEFEGFYEVFASYINTLSPFPKRFKWEPMFLSTSGPGAVKGFNTMSGFGSSLRGIFEDPVIYDFFQRYIKAGFRIMAVHNNLKILWEGTKDHSSLGPLGKLAFKQEPGKVRVFAMVDVITQWLFKPLHLWIFSVLRKIPQDATFDQNKAINKVQTLLLNKTDKRVWSFDLSAATDRLPLIIQMCILDAFKADLGQSWGGFLVSREFLLPKHSSYKKGTTIKYAVGQPMGALSSWAMLALTHHFVVQYASYSLSPNKSFIWFKEYMVLGDDIVIFNKEVADSYLSIMMRIGVSISPTKTLTSKKGVFEFAKRLADPESIMSGLSLAELTAGRFSLSIAIQTFRAYNFQPNIYHFMRYFGFGYKAISRIGSFSGILRRDLISHLGTLPNLTNLSSPSLGAWFVRTHINGSTINDFYSPLLFLCNKAMILVPNMVPNVNTLIKDLLFPHLKDTSFSDWTLSNLDLMFNQMFMREFNSQDEKRNKYIQKLESLEVPISDIGFDHLLEEIQSITTLNPHIVDDEDQLVSNFVESLESTEPVIDRSVGLLLKLKIGSRTILKADEVENPHHTIPLATPDKKHSFLRGTIHEGSCGP